jgi:hypothetical protein
VTGRSTCGLLAGSQTVNSALYLLKVTRKIHGEGLFYTFRVLYAQISDEFNHRFDGTHWLSLGLMIFGIAIFFKRTDKEIRLKGFQLPNRILGPVQQ